MNEVKIPKKEIDSFFQIMNDNQINYALITNNGDELPNNLKNGKDIDVLVSPNHIKTVDEVLERNGYLRTRHPKGRQNGWDYCYGSIEHQMWKKTIDNYELFIDLHFQLMCSSLQPRLWIPLDKCVNNDAINNRIFNSEIQCYEIDDESRLIYLIVRSIFDKSSFSDTYIKEIEKRSKYFQNNSFRYKMKKIFFNFTDTLIKMLTKQEYDTIIHRYITFDDY